MIKRFLLVILVFFITNQCKAVLEYKNWAWHFPPNSNMGIFIALALPIEDPKENVFLAYNVEANYLLPANESETVEFPPLVADEEQEEARNSKRINRQKVYQVIEAKLKTYKYSGRECLLRIICEVATSYFAHNGILGDIIHVLFAPSTSKNFGLPPDYEKAEEYGKVNKHCNKYRKKCSKNFADIISWFVNM